MMEFSSILRDGSDIHDFLSAHMIKILSLLESCNYQRKSPNLLNFLQGAVKNIDTVTLCKVVQCEKPKMNLCSIFKIGKYIPISFQHLNPKSLHYLLYPLLPHLITASLVTQTFTL